MKMDLSQLTQTLENTRTCTPTLRVISENEYDVTEGCGVRRISALYERVPSVVRRFRMVNEKK